MKKGCGLGKGAWFGKKSVNLNVGMVDYVLTLILSLISLKLFLLTVAKFTLPF